LIGITVKLGMRNLKQEPVKILFLGTDWESVETLKSLDMDERFDIVGVITSPDKPVGRKQVLTPSKVKEYGVSNDIPVFHTEKQKERYEEALEIFKPELIVCKAFGEILPKFFIDFPKYKSINIHFSVLPKYRGAVPIQKAILEGERETGISIMIMSEGMDEGDILKIFKEPILDDDTNLSLRKRLVKISADVLGDVLGEWVNGMIEPVKQDESKATYCWQKDISKENAQILWDTMEPEYIERLVRAMIPWPVAWCMLDGKRLKLFEVEIVERDLEKGPGEISYDNSEILFGTKKNGIFIKVNELQVEGKKQMSDIEFLNGMNS
jgi:methionyl-tRNA formyltransferase